MYENGYAFPEFKGIYVVRGYQPGDAQNQNIYLEEIVNKPLAIRWAEGDITHMEMGFGVNRFRELLPPQDKEIAELLAEVNSLSILETV
jgi:hypothetical protein